MVMLLIVMFDMMMLEILLGMNMLFVVRFLWLMSSLNCIGLVILLLIGI